MRTLTRREALAGATGLGAVAIAGCVSSNDDNEDDGGDAANSDPQSENDQENGGESRDNGDGPETELELVGIELTETSGSCGSGDQVEASAVDGDITLSGKLPASNPCHEAVVRDGTMEDGSLSMTVAVESTSGENETCASCLGVVDYEATLEFSEELTDLSALSSLTVEHGGRSGVTHTIEEAGVVSGAGSRGDSGSGDDAMEAAVLASSIVTTNRGCTGEIPPSDSPERIDADGETEFSQSDDTVTVDGSLVASTPCHEAYIDSVGYDSGTLSLTVGVESNTDPDELCVECLAEIEYEATVDVAEDVTVRSVSVDHIQRT